MEIQLTDLLTLGKPTLYKLHLARFNGADQPLDVFLRSRADWDGWNAWRGTKNDFSRPFIFSLIDFYREKDTWLFGGVYEVLSRSVVVRGHGYEIAALPGFEPFVGRLKVRLKRPKRGRAFNFENHFPGMTVGEILPVPYSGEPFRGYDEIDIDFTTLESIIKLEKSDWRTALEHAKGVYLITDTSNGRRYVGSAYGGTGLWSRWQCYVQTGHGYNDDFCRIIRTSGINYARKNFRFTLLEHRTPKTDDVTIIAREQYWKSVLMTRSEYGYNKN